MERVVIHKTVDQCWFCKNWFYQEVLKEIVVAEESYGAKTVRKLICNDCHMKIESKSKTPHPSYLTNEG